MRQWKTARALYGFGKQRVHNEHACSITRKVSRTLESAVASNNKLGLKGLLQFI